MKKIKKTYRALAATALIAMAANVLLPAGAAAARYICSTKYAQHAGTINGLAGCCSQPGQETDSVNVYKQNAAANHTEQDCSVNEIFGYALATELSATPVTLPNVHPAFAVLPPLTTAQIPFKRYVRDYFSSEVLVFFSSPPIFLLNSTFLN